MIGCSQDAPLNSSVRICTVKYCLPDRTVGSTAGELILLAVLDASGLKLYTRTSARRQVSEFDSAYIDELLQDLTERARTHPIDVFQQLSSLSSGPIITDATDWIELLDSAE
jgi:hypothetical protein